MVLTSPVDGVVLDVAKRSVGSVIREAEPFITIVQSDSELVGDIMINSSDIGYTHAGEEVVVKVDRLPGYQIHGMLKGKSGVGGRRILLRTPATQPPGGTC